MFCWKLKLPVLWNLTPCNLVEVYWRFRRSSCCDREALIYTPMFFSNVDACLPHYTCQISLRHRCLRHRTCNYKVYNLFSLPAMRVADKRTRWTAVWHQLPQYPHPAKWHCCGHWSALFHNLYFFLFAGLEYCGGFSPTRRNLFISPVLVSWRRSTEKNTQVRTFHFISNHVTRLLLQDTNKWCARKCCKSLFAVRLSWRTKQTKFL